MIDSGQNKGSNSSKGKNKGGKDSKGADLLKKQAQAIAQGAEQTETDDRTRFTWRADAETAAAVKTAAQDLGGLSQNAFITLAVRKYLREMGYLK